MADAGTAAYNSSDQRTKKKKKKSNNNNNRSSETQGTVPEVLLDLDMSSDGEREHETLKNCHGKRKNNWSMMDSSSDDNSVCSVDNPRKKSASECLPSNKGRVPVIRNTPVNKRFDDGISSRRQWLNFPSNNGMDFHDKVKWTVRLSKRHQEFEVLFKEGKNIPFVTVKNDDAVEYLTTERFENVLLEKPAESLGECTKIILFDYPVYLDPEDMMIDDRFMWTKRREVRRSGVQVPQPQLIALIKGLVPEKVFLSGLGYKRIAIYNEPPILCYKCCKWGHMAWKCHNDYHCRFCSKRHDSKVCGDKIKVNEKIKPKCCNCGGTHNASAWMCPKRLKVEHERSRVVADNKEGKGEIVDSSVAGTSSTVNVWEERMKVHNQTSQKSAVNEGAGVNSMSKLRKELDELKQAVLDIKKCLMNIVAKNVTVDEDSLKENESMVEMESGNAHSDIRSGQRSNLNRTNDIAVTTCRKEGVSNKIFNDVTNILDSVLEYMESPNEECKKNVLASVRNMKSKLYCNGS